MEKQNEETKGFFLVTLKQKPKLNSHKMCRRPVVKDVHHLTLKKKTNKIGCFMLRNFFWE